MPVQVKSGWNSKTVTTLPPKYVPHSEYSFECELMAETPILIVLILQDETVLQFQKFGPSAASSNINIRLSFFPYDWHHSNDVQINLYQQVAAQANGIQMAVNNELLKQDPRQVAATKISSSGLIETGKLIELAKICLPTPISAQFLVIPLSETESTHGRWRLKNVVPAELPVYLSFLAQGRYKGRAIANFVIASDKSDY